MQDLVHSLYALSRLLYYSCFDENKASLRAAAAGVTDHLTPADGSIPDSDLLETDVPVVKPTSDMGSVQYVTSQENIGLLR